MCNKSSSATSIRQRRRAARATVAPKPPARKIRTKTRKPKYLSLKLELSTHKCNNKTRTQQQKHPKMPNHKRQHQLDLFPLHPENLVQQDKVDMQEHDDHVALLFETATDTSTNTLQGLLDSATTTTVTTATTTTSEESPLSPPLHWGCDHGEDKCGGSSSLERTAMRCKERDASEERWVSYWEVVKTEQQEVSSTTNYSSGAGDATGKMMQVPEARQGLVGLKLDYQEIMNAWCDKGSLYVEGEPSQTVPDILLDGSDAFVDTWGSMGNSWAVPEMAGINMKFWHREASVLRYKEKRQSRLFSKRIRYQVRKLNAEKRPRLKGRFVKRNEEL